MNLFKRLDSKSPLPADSSRSVTEVPRAATAPNLDGMVDDDETEDEERQRSRARHAHRHSAPSPSTPMHPASPTATLTEESAARPLSPSSTITDRRDNTDIDDEEDSPAHMRVSALSPTLPLPTLIPEDSPHKYGLKDRTDTPEANSPPPPDAELAKARCRSSGLAIFKVCFHFLFCYSHMNITLTFNPAGKKASICLVLSQWPEHRSPSRRVSFSVSQRDRQFARHNQHILQLDIPTKPHWRPALLRKPTGLSHGLNNPPILLDFSDCIPANSHRSRPRPQHRHDESQQRPALQVIRLRLRTTHLHHPTQVLPITPASHALTKQARTSRMRSVPR